MEEDKIDLTKVRGLVVNIASELSAEYKTPDNDRGAFDTAFCSQLEELIYETLKKYQAKQTNSVRYVMED